MTVDGAVDPGVDLSTISDEFLRRNIVLILVGVAIPDFATWNAYRTFAHRTGMSKRVIYVFLNFYFQSCLKL